MVGTDHETNLTSQLFCELLNIPGKSSYLTCIFDVDAGSLGTDVTHRKKMLDSGGRDQSVKILMGSIGSKSNKVVYVKELLNFLSQHSNMSKSVMWTPATTRVAALYSAADVYVINSQVHKLFIYIYIYIVYIHVNIGVIG